MTDNLNFTVFLPPTGDPYYINTLEQWNEILNKYNKDYNLVVSSRIWSGDLSKFPCIYLHDLKGIVIGYILWSLIEELIYNKKITPIISDEEFRVQVALGTIGKLYERIYKII